MLEVRNLTKVYKPKKGKPVTALNNVSIKFEETGMVFVLGKSGSGKSTLLNLMGGLDSSTGGEIIIKGKSSKDFSQGDFDSYRNTYLGFIFQEYNILNEFSVGQNIALALELQGKKSGKEAVDKILKEVDLEGYAARKPSELSGGQKQRVAIARALIKDPEVIMADEPTGALDSNTGRQVFETLQKLSKTKLVIIVSHDREYAEFYGDRVIEFKDGKVVSDIKKYKAPSKIIAGGNVTITDDKIMQIKKGYKFKPKERNDIIKFLENAPEDLIISADARANKEFQRNTRIDSDGHRDSFKDTTDADLKLAGYNEKDFKLKKSRLPGRHAFRIGASSLKFKPIRLFITILLSAVAFALFGLADTIGSYNKVTATYNSLNKAHINLVALSKTYKVGQRLQDGSYTSYNFHTRMNDADLAALNAKFPNTSFTKLKYLNDSNFYNNINGSGLAYYYHMTEFNGYIESSAAQISQLGFTMIGTYPAAANEIAITMHAFESFKDSQYYDVVAYSISEPSEMFNKTIKLGNINYTITAVIDTGFDSERYGELKDDQLSNIKATVLRREMSSINKYSYHCALFTSSEFAEVLQIENPFIYRNDLPGFYNYSYFYGDDEEYLPYVAYYKDSMQSKITILNDSVVSGGTVNLADNQIIISSSMFNSLFSDELNNISSSDIYDEMEAYINQIFETEIKDKLVAYLMSEYSISEANALATATPSNYYNFLCGSNVNVIGYGYTYKNFYTLPLEPTLESGEEIYNKAKMELLKTIIVANPELANILLKNFYKSSDTKTYEIVGIYNISNFYENSIIFSKSEFENKFTEHAVGDIVCVIVNLPSGRNKATELIGFSYKTKDGVRYNLQSTVSSTLNSANSMVEDLSKVFLYVGMGFAVFASFMLLNFITISIANKRKEIGILRAIGARSSDVFKIFFYESLIITLINATLAIALTIVGCVVINNQIFKMGIMISLLNFGIRQILLILAVGIVTAAIASFLPVYNISRKKPVDAIKK